MGLALLAGALVAAPAAGAPVRSANTPRRAASAVLADSVIARLPHKDLTARQVLGAWRRLDPRYRPGGKGLARKRAFLDQLIEKEAIALAANAEPFVMTDVESAQFLAARSDLVRRGLYRRLVADSTVITAADRDTARARLTSTPGGEPVPGEVIESSARTLAQERRATEVNARIRTALAPAWDDSACALLARGYAALDPKSLDPKAADLAHPVDQPPPNRRPELAPSDTARALASSTVGPLTVGEFVHRFGQMNPSNTPLPTTPSAIESRGEQFLGQIWFDQEAERQELVSDPEVAGALAGRREGIALDHYYARHVLARIDTSGAVVRARFARDPGRYAIEGHALVKGMAAADSAAADTILAQLRAGTPWDSLCALRLPAGADPNTCTRAAPLPDTFADSTLVAALRALKPGGQIAHRFMASGPSPGAWVVVRLVERVPRRLRTFEEASGFAANDATSEQSEILLQTELARLKKALHVARNEAALARLDFGSDR